MKDLLPHLFIDSDGVVCDFDKLAKQILGMEPRDYEDTYGSKAFWDNLKYFEIDGKGFFESLDLMPDAKKLLVKTSHISRTVLTGAPSGKWAMEQKINFFESKFPELDVIVVSPSKDKIKHIKKPGDILIDDTLTHRHHWENGGGVFIHHTNTNNTLKQLENLVPLWFQRTDYW